MASGLPIPRGSRARVWRPADGTLIAYSQASSGNALTPNTGTNLLQNGMLVTAFIGLTVGWLDNNRLVVNQYRDFKGTSVYSGCAVYGADGAPTGAACAIPYQVTEFSSVASDAIYVAEKNQILSVSAGIVAWGSGDPSSAGAGAVAASKIVFVSGTDLVAQSY